MPAERDETFCSISSAEAVVAADDHVRIVCAGRAPDHHRQSQPIEQVHRLLFRTLAEQDHRVGRLHCGREGALAGGQQHAVVRGRQFLRDAAEQFERIRIRHRSIDARCHLDDDRDRVTLAQAQVACADVELVAVLGSECAHLVARLRGNDAVFGERARDGDLGDAGQLGQIGHGHRAFHRRRGPVAAFGFSHAMRHFIGADTVGQCCVVWRFAAETSIARTPGRCAFAATGIGVLISIPFDVSVCYNRSPDIHRRA